MTPACLDALARLLNEHCHEDNDDTNAEGAVKIFRAVQRHRG
jgi:hypothetical protein